MKGIWLQLDDDDLRSWFIIAIIYMQKMAIIGQVLFRCVKDTILSTRCFFPWLHHTQVNDDDVQGEAALFANPKDHACCKQDFSSFSLHTNHTSSQGPKW